MLTITQLTWLAGLVAGGQLGARVRGVLAVDHVGELVTSATQYSAVQYSTGPASPGHPQQQEQESSGHGGGLHSAGGLQARPLYRGAGAGHSWRGHFVDSIC